MLNSTQSWPLAIAAKAKMKNLPENFLIYKFEWLGDITDRESCVMEVIGAVFREAKSGPRKGELCIMVKGTEKVAFLTPDEIDALPEDKDDEDDAIESEYVSYLESGGNGEEIPLEFDEWKKSRNESDAILVTNFDDWEALYVDGKLVAQGHSIQREHFIGLLNLKTIEVEQDYVECGPLPDNFDEIPKGALIE